MVLVIKSQSEPLSPRVGIESWHQEPSSRKGVNKLWPMGQAQLSVYIKFYWNRAAPTTPLGTDCLWLLSWGRVGYLLQELYTSKAKSIYYVALYRKKKLGALLPRSRKNCS